MNPKVLRDIPLKMLQRKLEDDHVNLLQACYDNTIFNESATKGFPTQNGSAKTGRSQDFGADVFEDGVDGRDPAFSAIKRSTSSHVACNHMHSIQVSKPIPNEVTFPARETRSRPVIPFLLCLVLVLAVTIGLLVYFLGHITYNSSSSSPSSSSSRSASLISPPVLTLVNFQCRLTIIDGPFAVYSQPLADIGTSAFTLFRKAFVFKMDKIFTSSDAASMYNRTHILLMTDNNGHTQLSFAIYVKPNIIFTEEMPDHFKAVLVAGFMDSVFVIDNNTISMVPKTIDQSMASTPVLGQCLPIQFTRCANITSYSTTTFPNLLGHKLLQEIETAYENKYEHLFIKQCYTYAVDFYCSVFAPECGTDGKPIPPCRKYCQDVTTACSSPYDGTTPLPLSCDTLPDSEDPKVCRQNPYQPGVCVPVTNSICQDKGFNYTAYPSVLGAITADISAVINANTIQTTTSCFRHILVLTCALTVPPCSGKPYPHHYIPPCSSLCIAYMDRCGMFHDILSHHWVTSLNCSLFPDSPDPSVCVGYHEAREEEIHECQSNEIKCGKDRCIHTSWLCDGFQDCDDNSDEANCAMCGRDEQMCSPASSLCIKKSQGCDGSSDCYMNVDEHFCVRMDKEFDSDVLQAFNAVSNQWEEVCQEGWTSELSDITCRQLGYKSALATYFVLGSKVKKSIISTIINGSDAEKLQSYLDKGHKKCPSGYVVKLVCWQSVCGTRPAYFKSAVRVVGGDEVKPGSWPWMATLHGGSGEKFFCGATIIDPQWVLTAGHCVGISTKDTSTWIIKVGNTRREAYSEHKQTRRALALYVHQDFMASTVDNDIALIHLDKPLALNDFVRPICLPDHIPDIGTRCYATGWGKSSHIALSYENVMRQVALDVTSSWYCIKAITRIESKIPFKLTNNMFCAGGAQSHDACQGDSGGPLVCWKENSTDQWYQGGIISWGLICGQPNTPGVYTNLHLYRNWIQETISNNSDPIV